MRKIIAILGCLLILATSFPMAGVSEVIELISKDLIDGQTTVVITEDVFQCSWQMSDKVDKYKVFYGDKTYELSSDETSFRADDIEYGTHTLEIIGYDNNDRIISRSDLFFIIRIDETIKDISIKSPADNSTIYGNRLPDKIMEWNMIYGADDYRIAFYENNQLINEFNIYNNMTLIPRDVRSRGFRTIKIVVEALKKGEVISEDSVTVDYRLNDYHKYAGEVIGIADGDVIFNNRINCIYQDNASELDKNMYYNFKITNKYNGAIVKDVYKNNEVNYSHNEIGSIKEKLEDGKYQLEITAFQLSHFPKGYDPSRVEDIKELVEKADKKIEFNKELISFEVKYQPEGANAPSPWAKEYIDNNIDLIPYDLDSDYRSNLTRGESCSLLVPFYENETHEYFTVDSNQFSDTDSIDVNKASIVGIVHGMGDGTFAPNSNVTREQFSVMVLNMFNEMGYGIKVDYTNKFKDHENISSWAKEAVYFLSEKGIIEGVGNNEFKPKGFVTREQSIIILSKVRDYHNEIFEDSISVN